MNVNKKDKNSTWEYVDQNDADEKLAENYVTGNVTNVTEDENKTESSRDSFIQNIHEGSKILYEHCNQKFTEEPKLRESDVENDVDEGQNIIVSRPITISNNGNTNSFLVKKDLEVHIQNSLIVTKNKDPNSMTCVTNNVPNNFSNVTSSVTNVTNGGEMEDDQRVQQGKQYYSCDR